MSATPPVGAGLGVARRVARPRGCANRTLGSGCKLLLLFCVLLSK